MKKIEKFFSTAIKRYNEKKALPIVLIFIFIYAYILYFEYI